MLPHPLFERDGQHLVCRVPITYAQAALGTTLEVPTLDGRGEVEIPAGTQSGAVFKLGGKGMPDPRRRGLGDLLVQVIIEVPKKLSKEEQTLLRELAELEHKHVAPERKELLREAERIFHGRRRRSQDWPTDEEAVSYMIQRQRSPNQTDADDDDGMESETIDMRRHCEDTIADAANELAAANDRLLRLQAEMQNLRNRTSREIADERKYAALPVLRDLLPVLDNIDRAIEAAEKAGEAENLLAGFRLVRQQLRHAPQPASTASRSRPRASRSTRIFIRRFCSSRRPTCRPAT